jgi:hypothetical protein
MMMQWRFSRTCDFDHNTTAAATDDGKHDGDHHDGSVRANHDTFAEQTGSVVFIVAHAIGLRGPVRTNESNGSRGQRREDGMTQGMKRSIHIICGRYRRSMR